MLDEAIQSKSLQEDLLIILCYYSKEAQILRGIVEPKHFDGVYRKIVNLVFNHIDRYSNSPGHALPNILEDLIERDDGTTYEDILKNLVLAQKHVNIKYAMDRISAFIRRQNLRMGVLEASTYLQGDVITDENLEAAEDVLNEHLKKRLDVFLPGIWYGNKKQALSFLTAENLEFFPTDIPELDSRKAGPVRGGLHLYVAPAKSGKTHWMCHLGKAAIMARKKVLHVSLEMSEARVAQRYAQSLFAVANRNEAFSPKIVATDIMRNFTHLETQETKYQKEIVPKISFDMENTEILLGSKWVTTKGVGGRLHFHPIGRYLQIKDFPTGSLTIRTLSSYLDILAERTGFVPDILLLDYADLMKIGGNFRDYRISLGEIYKELRGLAMERNIAVATVSQSTRASSKAGRVGSEDVSEDWSKIATADTVVTYGSTKAEKSLNLGRISVVASRNDECGFSVVISQNYATGQFCLSSAKLSSQYENLVKNFNNEKEGA